MIDSIKLSDLNKEACSLLREETKTRPPIWLLEKDGKKLVIKDFSAMSFIYRNTAGRLLVWREARAYKILKGIKGIPQFYGTINGLAIVLEAVEGQNLQELEKELFQRQSEADAIDESKSLSPKFFDNLKTLVEKIHERGIVHCDLKRTPNIIIGPDRMPYIIDWASYMTRSFFSIFPLSLIYKRFSKDDCLAVTKHKVNIIPEQASKEELQTYRAYKIRREKPGPEKFFRSLRQNLRELIRKII